MSRSETKPVTEEEEKQIREDIEEFTYGTRGTLTLLHIPEGDTTDPLCGYAKNNLWRRVPVDAFPVIGYRDICPHCAEEHFEHR